MKDRIVVIGAGGGGILAAWSAARHGAHVLLLERNQRPGIKILISGGGKCNVTHAGTVEELLQAFVPRERRFLKPSFFAFSNDDIQKMLEVEGVNTLARMNGRVFPTEGTSRDIMRAFVSILDREGVNLKTSCPVNRLLVANDAIRGVIVGRTTIAATQVVLATGGVSYPKTGTTGDGYRWAEEAGHTIVPLRPALAPIGIEPPLPPEWRGVALRDGCLSAVQNNRTIASWAGDILFSHEGVTGPAALEVSRSAALALERGPVEITFDFFPGRDFASVEQDLLERIRSHSGRTLETLLDSWMPNRIVPWMLQSIGVDPQTRGYVLQREQRKAIVGLLKAWRIGRAGTIALARGEVTAGGVSLGEVDPKTMESRIVKGLYLCGEVLDIAGPVGGYNLQAAFSTGYVAGKSAARHQARNSPEESAVIPV